MQVFISHSTKDNIIVHRILRILDDNHIPHWEDLTQIDMTSSINQEINKALGSSSHFLLIWSKNASESTFVAKEYNAVITPDYDRKIAKIIIRIDDTPLPPLLSDNVCHTIKDEGLENTIENIASELYQINANNEMSEEFDQYLDDFFGSVFVAGYEYSTSSILKQIDLKVYKEYMRSWMSNTDREEMN